MLQSNKSIIENIITIIYLVFITQFKRLLRYIRWERRGLKGVRDMARAWMILWWRGPGWVIKKFYEYIPLKTIRHKKSKSEVQIDIFSKKGFSTTNKLQIFWSLQRLLNELRWSSQLKRRRIDELHTAATRSAIWWIYNLHEIPRGTMEGIFILHNWRRCRHIFRA